AARRSSGGARRSLAAEGRQDLVGYRQLPRRAVYRRRRARRVRRYLLLPGSDLPVHAAPAGQQDCPDQARSDHRLMRPATATLRLGSGLLMALGLHVQREAHAQLRTPSHNIRCSINSVTSVAFGTYDTDSTTQDTSTGQLRFSCQPSSTLTIQVAIGPSA